MGNKGEGKFDAEYKRLNTGQREAVDAIEGPVMVVAGPGTGKTAVLTLRIANILHKTDVPPDAILALTFTESAAGEMRKRLVSIVGPAAYRVNVATFHGFANEIIGKFPNYFKRLVGATNIGEVEKASLLEEIFDTSKLDKLRPYGDPHYYLDKARGRISELKRDGITPEDYLAKVNKEEKEIRGSEDLYHAKGAHKGKMKGMYSEALERVARLQEFVKVYKKYEELLAKRRLYDYDDMILEVVRTMQDNEDFRLRLSEEYQYILADEHQDANGAQNKLLELLASFYDSPNLFLVGDEKQAIFRFQGASLENFRNFKERYKDAKVVVLQENYRSHQEIIDAAHSLMRSPTLLAKRGTGKHMRVATFANREQELIWLSKENLSGATILVRDNSDAEEVAEALAKRKIAYVLEAEDDLFTNTYVRQIVSFLYVVHDFGRDEYLLSAMHAPALGLDPLEVYKLFHQAYKERRPVYELLKTSTFANTYKLFSSWKSYEYVHGVVALIEKLCEESGLLALALGSKDPEGALLAMSGFLDYVRTQAVRSGKVDLHALIRHIELSHKYKIKHKIKDSTRTTEGVRIMTAHRSKGLEFERVYVVFAEDGSFGGRRPREHLVLPSEKAGANLDDERRLFYVALTRGKDEVTVSYSKSVGGREVLPTQFIAEIDSSLLEDISPGVSTDKIDTLATSLASKHEPVFALSDKEFVNERFAEQGLSVSALNNYLECPWKYFYQSLVRVPRAQDKFALFGTAVHEALNILNKSIIDGDVLSVEQFVDEFVLKMSRMPLPKTDMEESLEKGKVVLSNYYKTYKSTWSKNILSELDIKGVHIEKADIEPILLRGRIDKVELLGGNKVRVVDYKTGKPKSRNVLMGNTRTSNGNEHRQLLFYKILFDRYKGGQYVVEVGEINFVEPVQRSGKQRGTGSLKFEEFVIEPEAVAELEGKVISVAEEIRNLSFWNKTCETKDCEFCKLRSMLPD